MGIVAWPAQEIMFTLVSPRCACSCKLTGGTHSGPIAAGVRSIITTPSAVSLREFSACT